MVESNTVTVTYSPVTPPVTWTCEICGQKFNSEEELRKHLAEVHGAKKIKCPFCDQSFDTLEELFKHLGEAHQKELAVIGVVIVVVLVLLYYWAS